ncbi:hypothetical protein D3C72_2345470 [compost metagenome]
MRAISSPDSSKSKMSKLSRARSTLVVRGMAITPCWMNQRRVTWPLVLPCALAISPITASSAILPWARGDQAVMDEPSSRAVSIRVFCDR